MTTFFIFGILKNYEKIQMEFEQMVDALEFKLQPKVFVEYSSTLRAHLGSFGLIWDRLGSFGLVWTCLGLFELIWACLGLFQLMSHGRIVVTTVRFVIYLLDL